MVYYKRRPVQFVDIPEGLKATDEVWVIPETREIFRSYDVFEERMNFYRKAQFVCEGTGHSALTFFEALESERQFSEEVNKIFPEALKEPVLRRVQFAVTARLDHLVDQVYDELKADFYPGERVTVCLANGSRLHGVVREKARFPQVLDKDGNVARRASSKYLVQLLAPRENEEALVADEHLVRDRKIFTKAMLRGFIRNSVQRENWNGAPWLVKEGLAHEYNISTQVAKHLQRNKKKGHSKTSAPVATDAAGPTAPVATRTLKSKATPSTAAADASSESRTADEAMMSPSSGTRTDPGIGTTMAATPLDTSEEVSRTTTPRGGYLKDGTQASGGMFGLFASGSVGVGPRGGIRAGVKRKNRSPTREDISRDTKQSFLAYQRALDGRPEFIVDYHQAHMANAGSDPNSCNSATDSAKAVPVANGRRGSQATTVTSAALAALTASPQEVSVRPINGVVQPIISESSALLKNGVLSPSSQGNRSSKAAVVITTPQEPAVKYPIEDLEVPLSREGRRRPPLKFLLEDGPDGTAAVARQRQPLQSDTVGALLESWTTLQVFADLLKLDPFTFDDYIDALGIVDVPAADGSVDSVARCELVVEIHCAILKLLVEPIESTKMTTARVKDDDSEGEDADAEEEIANLMVDLPLLPEEETSDTSTTTSDIGDGDGEDSGSKTDNDDVSGDTPASPPDRPVRRVTRSRTSARAAAEAAEEARRQAEAEAARPAHCADAFFASPSTDWIVKLARREFRNGGWELILLGLLNRLTHSSTPRIADTATAVLSSLAPASTKEAYASSELQLHAAAIAARNYKCSLGLHGRVAILEMLTRMLMDTSAMRRFMEDCSARSTELRKQKVEVQKERKVHIAAVKRLQEEKRSLMPKRRRKRKRKTTQVKEESAKVSTPEEVQDQDGLNVSDNDEEREADGDSLDGGEQSASDLDDDDDDGDGDGDTNSTGMRSSVAPDTDHGDGPMDVTLSSKSTPLQKVMDQKRRKDAKLHTSSDKLAAPRQQSPASTQSGSIRPAPKQFELSGPQHDLDKERAKQDKAIEKLTEEIAAEKRKIHQLEAEIIAFDLQLRGIDTSRTRCLGIDRFWNRYYWFERNGMPAEGHDDGPHASAKYANGRLWVLGPDESEVRGFMADTAIAKSAVASTGMSVLRRREKEEGAAAGSGGVLKPGQWGYYDDPKAYEQLLQWLDTRGIRETKLRRELCLYKTSILDSMRHRMEDLGVAPAGEVLEDADDAAAAAAAAAASAMDQQNQDGHASRDREASVTRPASQQGTPDRSTDRPRPRISTRTQVHLDLERELLARHRSLRWKNNTAIRELGHLHVDSHLDVVASKSATSGRKRRLVSGGSAADDAVSKGDETVGSPAPPKDRKKRKR